MTAAPRQRLLSDKRAIIVRTGPGALPPYCGDICMSRYLSLTLLLLAATCLNLASAADGSRFSKTNSRSQYVHWIDLYDAEDKRIDPTDETGPPYSPKFTCGRCHDYKAIVSGHHFNGTDKTVAAGRPGEPWIWTDARTGTQIPLSYRGWMGTHDPGRLGISSRDFVLKFGHHLPGGGTGEAVPEVPEKADADESKEAIEAKRWKLSGLLNVDCMICHSNDHGYSQEAWWNQIQDENFAWAATAALGIGNVDGKVADLKDDFDPADGRPRFEEQTTGNDLTTSDESTGRRRSSLTLSASPPTTPVTIATRRIPWANTLAPIGPTMRISICEPVLPAPIATATGSLTTRCADSRARYIRPARDVATLSCRGCHMNDGHGGGRMGAPKPLHKGLPPLHFDRLSCTACHSGPKLEGQAELLQTSLAHALGLPSHEAGHLPPGIKAPVMARDGGMLYPHRAVWPAFWGQMSGEEIKPPQPGCGLRRNTQDVPCATRIESCRCG